MIESIRVKKGLRRMKSLMTWAYAAVSVIGVLFGIFILDHPWLSVSVGVLAGWIVFTVSIWTTTRAAGVPVPSVGWVGVDYGVKICVSGGAIVWGRAAQYLDVVIIGILAIVAILMSTAVQVVAFTGKGSGGNVKAKQNEEICEERIEEAQ